MKMKTSLLIFLLISCILLPAAAYTLTVQSSEAKIAGHFDYLGIPEDFNFRIDFGVDGRNNIDTYNGTFTKDLIINGTETIDFVIPAYKMLEIYEAFVEYRIFELPDDINAEVEQDENEVFVSWTPCDSYTLTYTCRNESRTIICEDGGPWLADAGPPESRNRLVAFIAFVTEYIYGTDEYQKMSPAEGGYL